MASFLRTFKQVDVFATTNYSGNPVAVVLDGDKLLNEKMKQFANWTNLSETTFIVNATDPTADYALKIFTTSRELPFAGHPTLGTCYAWLESGGVPRHPDYIVQECGLGLVKLRKTGEIIYFEAPPLLKSGPLDENEVQIIARAFGISRDEIISHAWCHNGPRWRAVMLNSSEKVLSLRPNRDILGEMDVGVVGPRSKVGVIAPCDHISPQDSLGNDESHFDFEVRAFCPLDTCFEDPVTGSLNAGIAQWLIGGGLAPAEGYIVRQGTALGRNGRVYISAHDGGIWVGGRCITCVSGTVNL
jgi:PhzF family phenazine biosynthesis protein